MPADYINNMEIMFRDIDLSKSLTTEFKEAKMKQRKRSFLDLVNMKVLNVGSWARGSETIPITLPVELEDLIPEVEEFYKSKYSGRKLQWHHHLANGTINFKNETGSYDLDVTTLQMAVLFAWNRRPKVRKTCWIPFIARHTYRSGFARILSSEELKHRAQSFRI